MVVSAFSSVSLMTELIHMSLVLALTPSWTIKFYQRCVYGLLWMWLFNALLLGTEEVPVCSCCSPYSIAFLTEPWEEQNICDRGSTVVSYGNVSCSEVGNKHQLSTAPLTQEVSIYFSCFTFWIFKEVSFSDILASAVRSMMELQRQAYMKHRPPDWFPAPPLTSSDSVASFHLHLSVLLKQHYK